MCGIAGIFSLKNRIDQRRVTNMTQMIAHRGPDGDGIWSNEAGNVCFGHRRLSIIDLSMNGAQPMSFLNRYTITYNGEIYNFRKLRSELAQQGIEFQSNTDTEVLLALYHIHGVKCLDLIDGMFAFALWDKVTETLFCARDRFGEKPFYFHHTSEEFIFGSEIKTIFAAGIQKELNQKRLVRYLASNEIEDTHDKSTTFFQNVYALEASHYLFFQKNGSFQKKRYYELDFSESEISFMDAKDELKRLMAESVSLRTSTSDLPVGISLSGGVDSSIIFHELNQIHSNTRSFTASFPGFIKDETPLVKLLHSNYYSQASFIEPTGETYLNELNKFCFHQDEPVRNANLFAQWTVFGLAKKENTIVLLDGQGADEVFAGYHLYFKPFLQSRFRKKPWNFRQLADAYLHSDYVSIDKHFYAEALFPKSYHRFTKFRKYYKGNLADLHVDFLNENEKFLVQHAYVPPNVNAAQKYNLFHSGLEQLLRYGDRSSMAHSLEVRLPFLAREVVEFAAKLPAQYKVDKGYAKYIERAAYDKLIPDEILWKKDKIGYEAPQSQWYESDVMKEKIHESIRLLQHEKIISDHFDISKWWQYIQTAKLLS